LDSLHLFLSTTSPSVQKSSLNNGIRLIWLRTSEEP